MHWHLFRYGVVQEGGRRDAVRWMVQEMYGHASNTMTRRYADHVCQSEVGASAAQLCADSEAWEGRKSPGLQTEKSLWTR